MKRTLISVLILLLGVVSAVAQTLPSGYGWHPLASTSPMSVAQAENDPENKVCTDTPTSATGPTPCTTTAQSTVGGATDIHMLNSMLFPWSGGALDEVNQNFYLFGGGHVDWSGNSVVSLNLGAAGGPSINLFKPSVRACSQANNTATGGPNTYISGYDATNANASCVVVDNSGHTGYSSITGPDAVPPSLHTYGGNVYVPPLNAFVAFGESAWRNGNAIDSPWSLDIPSKTWSLYSPYGSGVASQEVPWVYDPLSQYVYAISGSTVYQWNPATKTKTTFASNFPAIANSTNTYASVIDPVDHTLIEIQASKYPPYYTTGGGTTDTWISSINLDTKAVADWSDASCDNIVYSGMQWEWVDSLGLIVGYIGQGSQVVFYNPTPNYVATAYPNNINASGVVPSRKCVSATIGTVKGTDYPPDVTTNQMTGVQGRFRYSPSADVLYLINDANNNAWILRPIPNPNTLDVRDTTSSGQANRAVTFGRFFKQGEIAGGACGTVDPAHNAACWPRPTVDGESVTTWQADVKNRWADGTVKLAMISLVIPSLPSSAGSVCADPTQCAVIRFQASASRDSGGQGSSPTGVLTPTNILVAGDAYNFGSVVTFTGPSNTATFNARQILSNANTNCATGVNCKYWLRGPVLTAMILEDRDNRAYDGNTDGLTGNPLHPIFEAWCYPGSHNCEIGNTVENAWVSSTGTQSARHQRVDQTTIVTGNTTQTTSYSQVVSTISSVAVTGTGPYTVTITTAAPHGLVKYQNFCTTGAVGVCSGGTIDPTTANIGVILTVPSSTTFTFSWPTAVSACSAPSDCGTVLPTWNQYVFTRWRRPFWTQGAPAGIQFNWNMRYLTQTTAYQNYDPNYTPDATGIAQEQAAYTNLKTNYPARSVLGGTEGHANAGVCMYLSSQGSAGAGGTSHGGWVGYYNDWDRYYLLTGDPTLGQQVQECADAAGRFPQNMREWDHNPVGSGYWFDYPRSGYGGTGLPSGSVDPHGHVMSLNARRQVSTAWWQNWGALNANGPTTTSSSCTGDTADSIQFTPALTNTPTYVSTVWRNQDTSHMPDYFFVPYTLFGKYYYLEQAYFEAGYTVGQRNCMAASNQAVPNSSSSHNGYFGFFMGTLLLRDEAWGLRNLANAAFIAADADPEGAYILDKFKNNIAASEGSHGVTLDVNDGASPNYDRQAAWQWGKEWAAYGTNCGTTCHTPYSTGAGYQMATPSPMGFFQLDSATASYGSGAGCSETVTTTSLQAQSNFQWHFLFETLGMIQQLGQVDTKGLRTFMAPKLANETLNPNISHFLQSHYCFPGVDNNKQWITDWTVYQNNFKAYLSEPAVPTTWYSPPCGGGSGAAYEYEQMNSLAYATDLGAINGYSMQAAWNWYKNNKPFQGVFKGTAVPPYGTCSGGGNPQFTVKPLLPSSGSYTPPPTTHLLTVNIAGAGRGSTTAVSSGVADFLCSTGTCGQNYNNTATVVVTATPGNNAAFSGWSGDCTGNGTCSLTMSADHVITATFIDTPPYPAMLLGSGHYGWHSFGDPGYTRAGNCATTNSTNECNFKNSSAKYSKADPANGSYPGNTTQFPANGWTGATTDLCHSDGTGTCPSGNALYYYPFNDAVTSGGAINSQSEWSFDTYRGHAFFHGGGHNDAANNAVFGVDFTSSLGDFLRIKDQSWPINAASHNPDPNAPNAQPRTRSTIDAWPPYGSLAGQTLLTVPGVVVSISGTTVTATCPAGYNSGVCATANNSQIPSLDNSRHPNLFSVQPYNGYGGFNVGANVVTLIGTNPSTPACEVQMPITATSTSGTSFQFSTLNTSCTFTGTLTATANAGWSSCIPDVNGKGCSPASRHTDDGVWFMPGVTAGQPDHNKDKICVQNSALAPDGSGTWGVWCLPLVNSAAGSQGQVSGYSINKSADTDWTWMNWLNQNQLIPNLGIVGGTRFPGHGDYDPVSRMFFYNDIDAKLMAFDADGQGTGIPNSYKAKNGQASNITLTGIIWKDPVTNDRHYFETSGCYGEQVLKYEASGGVATVTMPAQGNFTTNWGVGGNVYVYNLSNGTYNVGDGTHDYSTITAIDSVNKTITFSTAAGGTTTIGDGVTPTGAMVVTCAIGTGRHTNPPNNNAGVLDTNLNYGGTVGAGTNTAAIIAGTLGSGATTDWTLNTLARTNLDGCGLHAGTVADPCPSGGAGWNTCGEFLAGGSHPLNDGSDWGGAQNLGVSIDDSTGNASSGMIVGYPNEGTAVYVITPDVAHQKWSCQKYDGAATACAANDPACYPVDNNDHPRVSNGRGSWGTYKNWKYMPGPDVFLLAPRMSDQQVRYFVPARNLAPFAPAGPVVNYTVTVTVAGSGTGTVSSSPTGITCPGTCSNSFTAVTLTAAATGGSTFAGWSGTDANACSGSTCTFSSLNAAKSVTATFNPPAAGGTKYSGMTVTGVKIQ